MPTLGRLTPILSFACLVLVACHMGTQTGIKQYHSTYQGIDFIYPAAWDESHEEHSAVDFRGANHCRVYISAMVPLDTVTVTQTLHDMQSSTRDMDHTAVFSDRPAWKGSQKPDGSFQSTTTDWRGKHLVEYDTAFLQEGKPLIVVETLREGDAECKKQLAVFESQLHIYTPDRSQ